MNSGKGLTLPEALAGVFRESDCDVRIKKPNKFVSVSFDVGTKMVREVLLDDCPNEHGGGH